MTSPPSTKNSCTSTESASAANNTLITRFAYGAAVPHIEIHHLNEVAVPLLHDAAIQKTINDKVIESSRKRFERIRVGTKVAENSGRESDFCGRETIIDKSPMPFSQKSAEFPNKRDKRRAMTGVTARQ